MKVKLSEAQTIAVEKLKEHEVLVNFRPFWSAEGTEQKPFTDHDPFLVPVWHVSRRTLIALEKKGIVEFTEHDDNGIQLEARLTQQFLETLN